MNPVAAPLGKHFATLGFMATVEEHSHMDVPEQGQLLQEASALCQGVHFIITAKSVQSFQKNPRLALSSPLQI